MTSIDLDRHAIVEKVKVISQQPRGLATNHCGQHGQIVLDDDNAVLSDGLGFERCMPDVPDDFKLLEIVEGRLCVMCRHTYMYVSSSKK